MNFTRSTGQPNPRAHCQSPASTALALAILIFSATHQPANAASSTPIVQLQPGLGNSASGVTNRLPEFGAGEAHLQTVIPIAFNGAEVNTIVGANTFYANGFTGQGTITANVEAGHIWSGHETLTHVTQFVHDPTAWDDPGTVGDQTKDLIDRHATWVGMTIGGRNGGNTPGAYQTGIAPGTDLRSGALADAWSGNAWTGSFGFNVNSFVTPYTTFFGASDVINSSWGGTDPFGVDDFTVALDGLANQSPNSTFVVSAGNEADPDNAPNTPPVTNTVGAPGSGYNAITVGALRNDGNNNYNSVANFSSRGPQDFGYVNFSLGGALFGCNACRAAVDIVAPGTTLTLAYYGGQTGGNNPTLPGSPGGPASLPSSYSLGLAGTSFSSPVVAGGAALLDSASYGTPALAANLQSRDARVIKAVLLNSADKISGWTNGQAPHPNGNGGVVTTQSLDYNSGAGAMNLTRAYAQYVTAATQDVPGTPAGLQGFVDPTGWDFGVVSHNNDNVYIINQVLPAGALLTVTLDWFRERALDAQLLTIDEIAQADLDLAVRDTFTGNIISESISSVNNVEHLSFQLPRTSIYQLEVTFFGTIFDFTNTYTTEQYGLAWSVAAVPEPATLATFVIGLMLLPMRSQRGRMNART